MTIATDQRVIATYGDYLDAEHAVDYLSDHGFPVERTAIVGRDMRLVEKILGHVGYKEAALRGAYAGAITGALIGWIFGLFDWISPLVASLWLAFDGLIFGAVVGALFGLLMHWAQHGRRNFASVRLMVPEHYDLVVDAELADRAADLLNQGSALRGPRHSGV